MWNCRIFWTFLYEVGWMNQRWNHKHGNIIKEPLMITKIWTVGKAKANWVLPSTHLSASFSVWIGPMISEHNILIKTGATTFDFNDFLTDLLLWSMINTRTNNWYAMTLVWSTQMIKYQIKWMFWWKHDIKIFSC